MKIQFITFLITLSAISCEAQTQKNMIDNTTNPLMCNPEKGICEIPEISVVKNNEQPVTQKKPVKIIYFTDPICSSCWGIEPQMRKLKLEYGNSIEIEYRMGGLLPDWSYNSGGISKPSDVAHHWDEISVYYDMPIDGDVWLEDPLHSSYPPSVAFKAAQMQDEQKAVLFLRKIREMVFLQKKNITKWEHLANAAIECGLDTLQFKKDYENEAFVLFQNDLAMARKMGVRGFPTIFFIDSAANQQTVYGFRPYHTFEETILKTYSNAPKTNYDKSWQGLFEKYTSLTLREFSELSGTSKDESIAQLQKLSDEGILSKIDTKNGDMWMLKKTER